MKRGVEPVLIGWTEYVDLPEWNVTRLRAKIDTGARSSALHVEDIVELPRNRIKFDVVLHREIEDGVVTEKGLSELRERMPHADIDKFAEDPKVENIQELFTVEMICKFLESKLNG